MTDHRRQDSQPDRPAEEAGLSDRAEEFIADADPTDQRGRPLMVVAFVLVIVAVAAILLLVGFLAN